MSKRDPSELEQWILGAIVAVIILIFLFFVQRQVIREFVIRESCIHPATDSMEIFVGECLNQGYEFSQCYYEYVDFIHGGEVLEMPSAWI